MRKADGHSDADGKRTPKDSSPIVLRITNQYCWIHFTFEVLQINIGKTS